MKTILIPTNFDVAALDCVSTLCNGVEHEELTLIFVHMFKLSDSITDLLMLSRRSREYEQVGDAFYQKLNTLKKEHPNLKHAKIEFLYSSTLSMFRNFLEENEVDYVLEAHNCVLGKINKSSIDPQVLIAKCGLQTIKVPLSVKPQSKPFAPKKEEQELFMHV